MQRQNEAGVGAFIINYAVAWDMQRRCLCRLLRAKQSEGKESSVQVPEMYTEQSTLIRFFLTENRSLE